MKALAILSACLLLISCAEEKQTPKPDLAESPVKAITQHQMQGFDVPGLAIGIMNKGEVIYTDAMGVKSMDTGAPLTTKSVFHMASVSKPFVATAIVQLVEQGKIDLDEKLTTYLPYFKLADQRYKDITIRQMLNHSSGIPDVDDYEWDKPQYDEGAAERFVRSLETWGLDFEPGSEYSYSNTAFDIMADVIAKVSGESFEDYMQKNILEPVGMVNSTFFKPEVDETLATTPHVLGDDLKRGVSSIYPYNRRQAPSSTLHSNVEDMLLWAQVNLNKGEINGNRIYSEASYELLTQANVNMYDEVNSCLSWVESKMHGVIKYSHSGGDTGYSTYFAFIPDKQAAIVLLVNGDRFWSAYAANASINTVIFNDTVQWKAPIHFLLKNYIVDEDIAKTKEIYFDKRQNDSLNYDFDNGYLDDLGYWLLDREMDQKALEIFKFMTELEPEHAGWVDSVADAYVAMDSIPQAIAWYEKALQMKPDQDFSREKLNELLGE